MLTSPCVALLGAAAVLVGLAPAAYAEHRTRLKVCVYNVDDKVRIDVDGEAFARFPHDGHCETETVSPGAHTLSTRGEPSVSSGEVFPAGENSYTFYRMPATVHTERGERTLVNLYFF